MCGIMNCRGWPFEDTNGSVPAAIAGRYVNVGGGASHRGGTSSCKPCTSVAAILEQLQSSSLALSRANAQVDCDVHSKGYPLCKQDKQVVQMELEASCCEHGTVRHSTQSDGRIV